MAPVCGHLELRKNRFPLIAFGHDSQKLVYLEFLAPITLGKAFIIQVRESVTLASKSRGYKYESLPDVQIIRNDATQHRTIQVGPEPLSVRSVRVSKTDRTKLHVALIHPEMTAAGNFRYLLGGYPSEPSRWFSQSFQTTPVPVLPHWLPVLWSEAQKNNLMAPVATNWGTYVWSMPGTKEWLSLISNLVRMNVLQG